MTNNASLYVKYISSMIDRSIFSFCKKMSKTKLYPHGCKNFASTLIHKLGFLLENSLILEKKHSQSSVPEMFTLAFYTKSTGKKSCKSLKNWESTVLCSIFDFCVKCFCPQVYFVTKSSTLSCLVYIIEKR